MEFKTVDEEIMLSDGRVLKIPLASENDSGKAAEKKEKKKIQIEKTPNIWGSSAGAGSDFFDLYRKQRADELNRTEEMEQKWKEYTANKLFQEKRKAKFEYMEQKSLKKKKKRIIKKQKMKEIKKQKKHHRNTRDSLQEKNSYDSSSNDAKENEYQPMNQISTTISETTGDHTHTIVNTKGNEKEREKGKEKDKEEETGKEKEKEKKKEREKAKEQYQQQQQLQKEKEEESPSKVDTTNFLVIKEDEIF